MPRTALAPALVYDGGAPVQAISASADGQLVAAAALEGTVLVRPTDAGDSEAPLTGHSAGAQTAVLPPDGATLATGGRDGRILFWSTATGERLVGIEERSRRLEMGRQ